MKPILPRRPNPQPKINLRKRSHGDSHEGLIVKSPRSKEEGETSGEKGGSEKWKEGRRRKRGESKRKKYNRREKRI
jgi:hypothetical protein